MTAKEMQKILLRKFEKHKYHLLNSYIYKWESDYFSITDSGYQTEIELKISYSDFKAEARKEEKFQIISCYYNNKSHYLKKGKLIYKVEYETYKTYIDEKGKRVWDKNNCCYLKIPSGKKQESIFHLSQTENPENFFDKQKWANYSYEKIASEVEIKRVGNCPNKFYYCCPEGIIPVSEIPEYAGLYYINPVTKRTTEVKKAPFIHKDKHNITKILLDKFYYKSLNLENILNAKN